ncbi:MAG TPA: protein kinase, partial [Anaeromyxobacteraceae bacterium]|nr:protein kinase [Anaeromyxobacteraceae bacterium]
RDEGGEPLHIVHCDVSPSNVFVSRRGEVKLGDFGVARPMGRGPAPILGKLRYLAPEQLKGGLLSPAVDVFGLGATLFELLTGTHAFPGDDPQEVVTAMAGAERRLPSALRPEVPAAVDALVVSALAAAPAERPRSAAAMATALEGLFDERIGNPLAIAALVRGVLGA